MIDTLISMLRGNSDAPGPDETQAARISVAALLVEAAHADDVYLPEERETIVDILRGRFSLSGTDAQELLAKGEAAQASASDLVRFTRVVKDAVPHEERVALIEAVWRVVYADGDRDADESALIRKLCGLLYVPDRDAGLARQRVLAALSDEG